MADPLTLRFNNPGAIEWGPFAESYGGTSGGRFATFPDMDTGYRAMGGLLDTYQNKHGLNTVRGIIGRWAPRSVDNNSTDNYIAKVASAVGIGPDDPLLPTHRPALMRAMAGYEAGRPVAGPSGVSPAASAPPSFTPTGRPMPFDEQTGKWIPEDVIKQRRDMAARMWDTPISGGKFSGLEGLFGGLGNVAYRHSADRDSRANQETQRRALEGLSGATDANSLARTLMSSGVPGLAGQGVGVLAHTFEKQADRANALEQQKQLFEFQKKLQQEMSRQEMQQNLDMLRAMGVMPGQPGATPAGTPPPSGGSPAPLTTSPALMGSAMAGMTPKTAPETIAPPAPRAPANTDLFTDDLLGEADQRRSLTQQQKAGIALVMKEKGKAVDFLTEKGEKLTETQTKDASYAERMLRAEAGLREVVPANAKGEFLKYDPTSSIYRFLPDWNVTNSPEWQKYTRNAREGVAAILRKDTGAAVTPEEWAWYFPMYYPQPGDSAAVVADKQRARIAVARGLRNASGPAFDQMFPRFNEQLRARLEAAGANLAPPSAAPTPAAGGVETKPGGTYTWSPDKGVTPAVSTEGAAPEVAPPQAPGPQESPKDRAARRRAEAPAQRAQQEAKAKADAEAVAGQFDTDRQAMQPLEFAQKYDPLRRNLSPQQLSVLNQIISQLR